MYMAQRFCANVVFSLVILIVVPASWVFINSDGDRTREDALYAELSDVRRQLLTAENASAHALDTVQRLRRQLARYWRTNGTDRQDLKDAVLEEMGLYSPVIDFSIPSMFHYLPHLIGRAEWLKPKLAITKGRTGVFLVIGITTVKRLNKDYLSETIKSLLDGLTNGESSANCLIVVCITETTDHEYIDAVASSILKKFPDAVSSGLLEVIAPQAQFYPPMHDLREQHGDNIERVKWRAKQNLDFSYIMMYARTRGNYYLQLEDDVIAKPGYLAVINKFVAEKNKQFDPWVLLEFSHLGFIGKLFHSSDLPMMIDFFLMFYKDKPVDWLLNHLIHIKACSRPGHFPTECGALLKTVRMRYKPSVFQHVGVFSSLKGKKQTLIDRDFHLGVNPAAMFQSHPNPPAQLSTSLSVYQTHTLADAYAGHKIFWATTPKQGDTIVFKFTPPIRISKYRFRSGSPEHPGDLLINTTVEILPTVTNCGGAPPPQPSNITTSRNQSDCFLVVNRFDSVSGLTEGSLEETMGLIEAVRLSVQSPGLAWVILSEIYIEDAGMVKPKAGPATFLLRALPSRLRQRF